MSFDSVKNTVNKEEISYLFQKDKTFDHIILTEKKHTDIIRMLSDLSELHVDPVLKRASQGIRCRAVADKLPPYAQAEEPSLEDAYLYLISREADQ